MGGGGGGGGGARRANCLRASRYREPRRSRELMNSVLKLNLLKLHNYI